MKSCLLSLQLFVTDCDRHPVLPALSLQTHLMNLVHQPQYIIGQIMFSFSALKLLIVYKACI